MSDDALIDRLQRGAFGYFEEETNPENGLVADKSREGSPASIAVVGLALSVYPVAVERGWLTREDAAARTLTTLRFFARSEQGSAPTATGYKGFYYHFLDCQSGERAWQSELSPIDTSFLVAGMLTAGAYFGKDSATETEIRKLGQELSERIDWDWSRNGTAVVAQGWKPESGFLHYGWEGYSEATLLYVLGLASPTHPLTAKSFEAWTGTYQWERIYGFDLLYAGPLFIHQFSHAWIDFRNIRDSFMREKRTDYFENTCRAIDVQRAYARRDPDEYGFYDSNCWDFQRAKDQASRSRASAGETVSFSNMPRVVLRTVQTTERSPPGQRSPRYHSLRPSHSPQCGITSGSTQSGRTLGDYPAASTESRKVQIRAAGSPTALSGSTRAWRFS